MAKLTGNTITGSGQYTFSANANIMTVWVSGSFGGGTMTLEHSFDGSNYLTVESSTKTANFSYNYLSAAPCGAVRLTGATDPDLTIYVLQNF